MRLFPDYSNQSYILLLGFHIWVYFAIDFGKNTKTHLCQNLYMQQIAAFRNNSIYVSYYWDTCSYFSIIISNWWFYIAIQNHTFLFKKLLTSMKIYDIITKLLEKSPSPVYGARLELVYGLIAHRGFESLLLRHENLVNNEFARFFLLSKVQCKIYEIFWVGDIKAT